MTNPPKEQFHFREDEITLKDMILKSLEFWNHLWRNKFVIIICALVFAGINVARTYNNPVNFTSAITFLVSEDNSDGRSAGILSSRANLLALQRTNNKITELAKSSRIIHNVLLKKVTIDSKKDYLANHIIFLYNFNIRWNEQSKIEADDVISLENFLFTRSGHEDFSEKELKALRQIHQIISGSTLTNRKGLVDIIYNIETDLFTIRVNANHSDLASLMMSNIYQELQDFYTLETVGRPRRIYEKLKIESDSLNLLLSQKIRQLALAKDRNKNVFGSASSLNINSMERQVIRLDNEFNTSYDALKSVELQLSKETPEFIEIDRTYFPIEQSTSKLKSIIIGGFLGTILCGLFLITKKVIKDSLG